MFLFKNQGGFQDSVEGLVRPLCDVQQGITSVGLVQNPEHGQFAGFPVWGSADGPIQSALAQLRFAFGIQIKVGLVLFQDLNNSKKPFERIIEGFGTNEVQIIGRRVVLGIAAVGRSRKPANRKIDAWRAKLPFIIPVWREIHDLKWSPGVLQDMSNHPVDLAITATAALVSKPPSVAQATQHKTIFYRGKFCFVQA